MEKERNIYLTNQDQKKSKERKEGVKSAGLQKNYGVNPIKEIWS